jgi:hypothetical protein
MGGLMSGIRIYVRALRRSAGTSAERPARGAGRPARGVGLVMYDNVVKHGAAGSLACFGMIQRSHRTLNFGVGQWAAFQWVIGVRCLATFTCL